MAEPSSSDPRQREEKVSYLREMLVHQANLYGVLSSLALGAVLALPYGFGVGALPLLAYTTGLSVLALFVPSSPKFRAKVDMKKKVERRERIRAHLTQEVAARADTSHPNWLAYTHMRERLESLRTIAVNKKTALTMRDVERLDDATVDFLGLWLSGLTMYERQRSMDEGQVRYKLDLVTTQLESALGEADRRRLEKAQSDLEQVLLRREQMQSRAAAVEAAMLAMSDTFDEVYQGVMTNPNSGDITRQLEEAVERMHIEEDLGGALDDDLESMLEGRKKASRAKAKAKAM